MSLVFISSGILFLLSAFNLLNFNKRHIKLIVMLFTSFLCASYFFGEVKVGNTSFNILLLISIILLFVLCSLNRVNFLNIFYILFTSIIYKFFLNSELNYLVSFENKFAIGLVLMFSIVYLNNFRTGLFFIINSSTLIAFISGIVGLDNFGYLRLDFYFMFDSLLLFTLITLIYRCLLLNIKTKGGNIYAKKKYYCCSTAIN